jgi:TolA-binding protein
MKTSERHHLKTNEFAQRVAAAHAFWLTHQKQVFAAAAAIGVIAIAIVAITAWRQRTEATAAGLLAEAVAASAAPVIPPSTSPGAPLPAAGSYPSETARDDAALDKLLAVASGYGSTRAGLSARYQAAALLVRRGRMVDAEREFEAVSARDGSGLFGRMARLGLAELKVQTGRYDEAIAIYREFLARRDGDLPVDGLLMHLARTYQLAGKTAEALQTFTRVADEHPQSLYAADARREAENLKTAAPGSPS